MSGWEPLSQLVYGFGFTPIWDDLFHGPQMVDN